MNEKKRNYRHELKYICSEGDLQIIEAKIKAICKADKHGEPSGGYNIRSVYFDTFQDAFFRENEAGVDNRKKYRIRIYNGDTSLIKLECKETLQGAKRKESCKLSREQCDKLLQGVYDLQCTEGQKLLQRFLLEAKANLYMPKIIVDYNRNAYVFPIGNVRITFDRSISSSQEIGHFLEPRIERRLIMPQGKNILEVKYDEVLPDFIKRLVMCCSNTQRTSFSKYYLCRNYTSGKIVF